MYVASDWCQMMCEVLNAQVLTLYHLMCEGRVKNARVSNGVIGVERSSLVPSDVEKLDWYHSTSRDLTGTTWHKMYQADVFEPQLDSSHPTVSSSSDINITKLF